MRKDEVSPMNINVHAYGQEEGSKSLTAKSRKVLLSKMSKNNLYPPSRLDLNPEKDKEEFGRSMLGKLDLIDNKSRSLAPIGGSNSSKNITIKQLLAKKQRGKKPSIQSKSIEIQDETIQQANF